MSEVVVQDNPSIAQQILESEAHLAAALERHDKGKLTMYNPLVYAVDAHCSYVCKFARSEKPVLFIGMSATPYGMAQTGVPLGNLKHVKDYLGLTNFKVKSPKDTHPKMPVTGWETYRSDPEGDKFWKFFEARYGMKEFTRKCYVTTYCPVLYVDEQGKEVPPPCLPLKIRSKIMSVCDMHVINMVDILRPSVIVAIGGFAYEQVGKLFCSTEVGPMVYPLLHPAPSNPIPPKRWVALANDQLAYAGVPQIIAGTEAVASAVRDDKKKKRCSKD